MDLTARVTDLFEYTVYRANRNKITRKTIPTVVSVFRRLMSRKPSTGAPLIGKNPVILVQRVPVTVATGGKLGNRLPVGLL